MILTVLSRLQHMIIGGLPLLAIAVINHDPAFRGTFENFTFSDIFALVYTSFFGSAISYGVYFYNATRGSNYSLLLLLLSLDIV